MASVLNCHHFGGADKLPPNAVYVGRGDGNIWGNRYSSKSGKFTKEECVALHRIDLYRELIADTTLRPRLIQELAGKDLACWCVHPKKVMACHAYNYLHVLNPKYAMRTYDKSIITYLMEDLRDAMSEVNRRLIAHWWDAPFRNLDICGSEIKYEISFLLQIVKIQQPEPLRICEYIADVVVELELLLREVDPAMLWWRVSHVIWKMHQFIYNSPDDIEPISPQLNLKRKPKGK